MKKLIFYFTLLVAASNIFARIHFETNNDRATISETKIQTLMYWFDANTGEYIGHMETTGCDNSGPCPCAYGYSTVTNPNDPQKPNTPPQQIETSTCP